MDGNSFISQLRDTRVNLAEAIRVADNLEFKFVGPRPAESGSTPKQTAESIGTILSDIQAMSMRLVKMLAHQHEIVGDFNPDQIGAGVAANPSRYA